MIIDKHFFFNKNTINIFTDASIKKLNTGEMIACPGCKIIETDENGIQNTIFEYSYIIRNATNNIGELSAIYLGVSSILNLNRRDKIINLFSDSLLCISSLREWIFNWINNQYNYIMYSSSGEPVKNQEIIKSIILLIYYNKLYINFYHQKGHVTNTDKSLNHAINVFNISNGCIPTMDLIKNLSLYNNDVDIFTKVMLDNLFRQGEFNTNEPLLNQVILSTLNNVDFDIYKRLISNKRKE